MRKVKLLIATLAISTLTTFPAFAEWKQEADGRWWYQNADRTWPTNQWEWIGGKYYYFGADGYMLVNTITPDGYFVGPDGAWIDAAEPQANETEAASTVVQTEVTLGMKNALARANRFLELMPFSYTGLVEQLEYEGYTHDEAVYGVNNCGADWNENAAKKAKNYLDIMSFSRQGLIEQLEYEGYTHDQAVYGVSQNGY